MRLLHQYIRESAQEHPEKPAIISDDRIVTYREMLNTIDTLAERFIVEGLQKGDRVLTLLHDPIESLTACLATIRAGGIAMPAKDSSSPESVEKLARECTPFMIVTGKKESADFSILRDKLSCHFFLIEDWIRSIKPSHISLALGHQGQPGNGVDHVTLLMNIQPDDGAVISYTPGTTGQPKGVLLTHRNLIQFALNANAFTRNECDVIEFVSSPLTQSFGFGRVWCTLLAGGTIVTTSSGMNPLSIVQTILKQNVNAISGTSATISMLINQFDATLTRIGSHIRLVDIGGGALPRAERQRLIEIFPRAHICFQYGLVEAPGSTFIDLRSERKKISTCGRRASNVEISILDEQGRKLPAGMLGEIVLRGEHVTPGYWNQSALNQINFHPEKWLRTGDIGFIDKEGYLHFVGRQDEMMTVGGHKISPVEVEEKIHEAFPDYEICVVGIPDSSNVRGEILVLCYIPIDGKTIIPSELSAALANTLDPNKIPRIVYRIDRIPKNQNNILRHELRRQIMSGMTSSTSNIA